MTTTTWGEGRGARGGCAARAGVVLASFEVLADLVRGNWLVQALASLYYDNRLDFEGSS